MHQLRSTHHFPAERRTHGLVPEADSQDRNPPGTITNQLHADAGFVRSARAGRNQDTCGPHGVDAGNGYLIVAANLNLRAQFAEILHQVVSERIVVVEDKDHGTLKTAYIRPDSGRTHARKYSLTPPRRHAMLQTPGGLMAETTQDNKRATRRFALRLPVSVSYANDGAQEKAAQTRDVSARGICFYVDSAISAGSPIEFTLTLPPEITLTESIRVRCRGKVVRVDEGGVDGKVAVAAVIDEYEFLSEP